MSGVEGSNAQDEEVSTGRKIIIVELWLLGCSLLVLDALLMSGIPNTIQQIVPSVVFISALLIIWSLMFRDELKKVVS